MSKVTPYYKPLPWAAAALERPGRSAFAGGQTAGASVGYSSWSTQIVLPFQSFAEYGDKKEPQVPTEFSSGSARINTNLRCGDVLPMTLKFGFFSDLTRDGAIDMNDAVVWTRQQYPRADWLMRAGLMTKIQNDMTSYTSGGCNGTGNSQSRVTFTTRRLTL